MNEELGNAEKIVKVDMSKLVTELLVVEKENEEHVNYIISSDTQDLCVQAGRSTFCGYFRQHDATSRR